MLSLISRNLWLRMRMRMKFRSRLGGVEFEVGIEASAVVEDELRRELWVAAMRFRLMLGFRLNLEAVFIVKAMH